MTQQGILHNLRAGQASGYLYSTADLVIVRAALRAGAPVDMAVQMATAENVEQIRGLHVVPLFHITGCGQFMLAFNDGKKLHFMRRWSANDAVELMIRYKLNQISGWVSLWHTDSVSLPSRRRSSSPRCCLTTLSSRLRCTGVLHPPRASGTT